MLKGNLVVSCAAWVQLSSLDASGVGTAALREREREEASGVPFFCTSLWKFALAQSCLKLKAHLPGFRGREPPCSWFNRITRLIASPDLALDWFPSNILPITVMIFFFPAVWKRPAAGVFVFSFLFLVLFLRSNLRQRGLAICNLGTDTAFFFFFFLEKWTISLLEFLIVFYFFLNPFCFTLSTGADSDTPWWCGAIRTNHKVYAIIWKLLVGKLNAIVSLAKVGPCCPPWICLNPRFVFVTDIFMFCARTRSSWLSTTFNKRNPNTQRLNAHFWIERICPAVTRKSQRLLFLFYFFLSLEPPLLCGAVHGCSTAVEVDRWKSSSVSFIQNVTIRAD